MLLIFRFDIYLRSFLIILKQKDVRLKIYLFLFLMTYPEKKACSKSKIQTPEEGVKYVQS